MQKKFSFESLSGSKEFKEVLSGKKLNSHLFTIFYKSKNFNDKKKDSVANKNVKIDAEKDP